MWGCLVTWFCYQMIAKPSNKTATPSWPDSYVLYVYILVTWYYYFCTKRVVRLLDLLNHTQSLTAPFWEALGNRIHCLMYWVIELDKCWPLLIDLYNHTSLWYDDFSQTYSHRILYSSPVRVSFGVFFVSLRSKLCPSLVIVKEHSIACPLRWAMECSLWVYDLNYVLHL